MNFVDYAEQYFENQKNFIRASSLSVYLGRFDKYIKPFFKNYKLSELNSRLAQQFLNYLCSCKKEDGKQLSKHTIQDTLVLFKSIAYDAMREGIIQEFTFKTKMPNNVYQPLQEMKMLKQNDYENLIEFLTNNFSAENVAIMISLQAGLRIGEVCGLKWEKVCFEDNYIRVDNIVNRLWKEREKTSEIIESTPKTFSGIRNIPMSNILREYLLEWKKRKYIIGYDENGLPEAKEPPKNYFVLRDIKPEEPRVLRNKAYKTLKSLGIDYIHFHNLRHTFCSVGLQKGVDIKVMSEFMGHAGTDITLNIYTHTTEAQRQQALEKINSF